ncbi:Hypothetical_protein [Hexamita inflata]|uniref:Hypothetical_protein n=1 Tax=Hexamita inflata TaxID=28002 RepID=A0AA86NEB8_9EUKA|nr:Hypothetical protein HINF_LOCUS5285 [Hexamita inflata]
MHCFINLIKYLSSFLVYLILQIPNFGVYCRQWINFFKDSVALISFLVLYCQINYMYFRYSTWSFFFQAFQMAVTLLIIKQREYYIYILKKCGFAPANRCCSYLGQNSLLQPHRFENYSQNICRRSTKQWKLPQLLLVLKTILYQHAFKLFQNY